MIGLLAFAVQATTATSCTDLTQIGWSCVDAETIPDNIVVVEGRRRLGEKGRCNAEGKCVNDAVYVTLGNGCFWERQYAYTKLEKDSRGPFRRHQVSALVGYTGSKKTGPDGQVCYHDYRNPAHNYGPLGHMETVQIKLDRNKQKEQFRALAKDFFSSFHKIDEGGKRVGMARPDDFGHGSGDMGSAYRSAVTIPGGIKGSLFQILVEENVHKMVLVEGKGSDPDIFNTVYVMDSDEYPFYVGEAYHQFHSNFFGPSYEQDYLSMSQSYKDDNLLGKTGCDGNRRLHLRGAAFV